MVFAAKEEDGVPNIKYPAINTAVMINDNADLKILMTPSYSVVNNSTGGPGKIFTRPFFTSSDKLNKNPYIYICKI